MVHTQPYVVRPSEFCKMVSFRTKNIEPHHKQDRHTKPTPTCLPPSTLSNEPNSISLGTIITDIIISLDYLFFYSLSCIHKLNPPMLVPSWRWCWMRMLVWWRYLKCLWSPDWITCRNWNVSCQSQVPPHIRQIQDDQGKAITCSSSSSSWSAGRLQNGDGCVYHRLEASET